MRQRLQAETLRKDETDGPLVGAGAGDGAAAIAVGVAELEDLGDWTVIPDLADGDCGVGIVAMKRRSVLVGRWLIPQLLYVIYLNPMAPTYNYPVTSRRAYDKRSRRSKDCRL